MYAELLLVTLSGEWLQLILYIQWNLLSNWNNANPRNNEVMLDFFLRFIILKWK